MFMSSGVPDYEFPSPSVNPIIIQQIMCHAVKSWRNVTAWQIIIGKFRMGNTF